MMNTTDVTEVLNDFIKNWSSTSNETLYRYLHRWPLTYTIASLNLPGIPLITFDCRIRENYVIASRVHINEYLHQILNKQASIDFKKQLISIAKSTNLFGPLIYKELTAFKPYTTTDKYPQFAYKFKGTSTFVWVGNDPDELPDGVMPCRRDSENLSMRAELGFSKFDGEFNIHLSN